MAAFFDGKETIYTARFHPIEPNAHLIYAFDIRAAGQPFSVSLAGVNFAKKSGATQLSYVEQRI